jgi:hypothetical protein
MLDSQLVKLTDVLKLGRIWAVNVGENFAISLQAWHDFAHALCETAVAHLYVEENNLAGTNLKNLVRFCESIFKVFVRQEGTALHAHEHWWPHDSLTIDVFVRDKRLAMFWS